MDQGNSKAFGEVVDCKILEKWAFWVVVLEVNDIEVLVEDGYEPGTVAEAAVQPISKVLTDFLHTAELAESANEPLLHFVRLWTDGLSRVDKVLEFESHRQGQELHGRGCPSLEQLAGRWTEGSLSLTVSENLTRHLSELETYHILEF